MIQDTIEKVKKLQHEKEIAQVCFLNDRTTKEINYRELEYMTRDKNGNGFAWLVERAVDQAAELFAYKHNFDYMIVSLNIGVIYNKQDLFEDNKFKVGAAPLEDIVYVSVKDVDFYLNSSHIDKNDDNPMKKMIIADGYMRFDDFMKEIDEQGLAYNGPDSFYAVKSRASYGRPEEITIGVDFTKYIERTNTVDNKSGKKRAK
ncbi:MAG: hypothetical protein J6X02_05570 [Bacilli bacterium]|nr:hypothetical protein [Bacilli bacterium]